MDADENRGSAGVEESDRALLKVTTSSAIHCQPSNRRLYPCPALSTTYDSQQTRRCITGHLQGVGYTVAWSSLVPHEEDLSSKKAVLQPYYPSSPAHYIRRLHRPSVASRPTDWNVEYRSAAPLRLLTVSNRACLCKTARNRTSLTQRFPSLTPILTIPSPPCSQPKYSWNEVIAIAGLHISSPTLYFRNPGRVQLTDRPHALSFPLSFKEFALFLSTSSSGNHSSVGALPPPPRRARQMPSVFTDELVSCVWYRAFRQRQLWQPGRLYPPRR
ncbi:hypothetical protein FA13DRAFT_162293 [Coprinellus micaceus]|uniref:Uncharacterized protein n=1 Tax=Coprinellus micaceus TaxID=71717 RepID=A0A4Y7THE9_COPMI|nr:hypothetical protein FA13DRAFT_162293 [Coprinellus micaceus]